MNGVKHFFHKYLFTSLSILIIFFLINILFLFGLLLTAWNNSTEPDIPISQITDCIHFDDYGSIYVDSEIDSLLNNKAAWAMVIDNSGSVIWEDSMPDDLPREYSISDVAKFSHWYLDKYPVLIQEMKEGLLVVACPPNSILKYNIISDKKYIQTIFSGIIFGIILNISIVLLLFCYNTRKVEKAVSPILTGIENISQANAVELSEKGELVHIKMELNKASLYIRKKHKARAEWINGISHDIRTPLSIILGYASEIEDDTALPERTRTQAGIICRKGEKLRGLITDLNLTSKLEYAMQPLHIENICIVETIRQIISEYLNNGLDEKYSIDLCIDPADCSMSFNGDNTLLIRLFDNLINNAVQSNPDGCSIIFEINKKDTHCSIQIKDNGIGMSDSQIISLNKNIFSKQNDMDLSGEPAHGLGLRLSTQIVKAHHGQIVFENQAPHGLCVSIDFPLKSTLV